MTTTFAALGIRAEIIKGLDDLGFAAPTPVQEQIIPVLLDRPLDIVGMAQTGTGKTAAFGIPLVQLSDPGRRQTQALVLCPTRELCVQVTKDLVAFARYLPGFKIQAVYGGASIETQIRGLRQGAQIIVATPGRLHDLIRRQEVDISAIRVVVLDEADEMLQMGFQEELTAILAKTPATKNTLLFSATMPKGVAAIAANYMKKPLEVTVGQRNAGAENVRHIFYMVQAKDRYLALKRIIDLNPDLYAIVFCRTRLEVNEVAEKLMKDGYSADSLHGELSQAQRDHVMQKFRSRGLQILVATDVAARGLDVTDLTHVLNYNLPDDLATYTHRSGRTGRAGKAGVSVAIIHLRERSLIREIEGRLGKKFEEGRIPSGYEVCQRQLLHLVDTMRQVEIDHERIEPFLAAVSEKLAPLDREELIKRFLSVELNRFLEYYRNAPDLNVPEKGRGREVVREPAGKFQRSERNVPFTRLVLNIGKKDGMHATRLIGQINEASGPNVRIGKIDIKENATMFEAESRFVAQVVQIFERLQVNGRKVSVEVVTDYGPKESMGGGRPVRKSGPGAKPGFKPGFKQGFRAGFKPGFKTGPGKKGKK
jgi:ATP-dependent RNA helicase DeaD